MVFIYQFPNNIMMNKGVIILININEEWHPNNNV